ncbi:Pro-kumamolisin, activation domain-containing protein [Xylogone sp. PMI_703]|nr:Pro-kumamolisin, activation domain-containing protein [Xylogone sp. PMI_703]
MLFRSLVAAFGLGLALESLASPLLHPDAPKKREVPNTHALHERHTSSMAKHWAKREKLPRTAVLPMRIGLKQSNLDMGHSRLMEISTPGSAHYGKHMTSEEVIEFFAPAQSSVDAVMDWLVSSGIAPSRISQSTNKQWIQFDAAVDEVEDLLVADFYLWETSSGEHKDIACEEYHVPAHVQQHIDYVTPGIRMRSNSVQKRSIKTKPAIHFPATRPSANNTLSSFSIIGNGTFPGVNSTSCSSFVTADCIRVQYGVPNGTTAAAGNELGIFENLNDHYSTADLDTYLATLYPYQNIPAGTYPENRLINGAIGSYEDVLAQAGDVFGDGVGGESTLDFQAAMPLIWPQKPVLFQTDDELYEIEGTFGWMNSFLDAIDGSYCTYSAYGETGDCTDEICADPVYPDRDFPPPVGYQGSRQCGAYKPTNVISISYGAVEDLLPNNYQYRQCNEYMKLGLQGVTVVLSSGDSGVGSGLGCIGGPAAPDVGTIFAPSFPQGCPYLLTVGSTELRRADPTAPPVEWEILEEVASTQFPSGGGFSNIWGVADYQRDAVQAYYDQVEDTLPFNGFHQIIINGSFDGVTRADQVYHHGGRGFPDVAAVGENQIVLWAGDWWTQGGTSLSAPLWASVLTLINEKRIAAGKSSLGFVNPTLVSSDTGNGQPRYNV